MSNDRWDELGARLFEAARLERPSDETFERAAFALEHRRRAASRWAMGAVTGAAICGVAALAAASALWIRDRASREPEVTMEPPSAGVGKRHAPIATLTAQPIDSEAVPVRSIPTAIASTRPMSASLADEIGSLNHARTALGAGDAAEALRELDRYERVLRGTRLRSEATFLRVQSLARAGRSEESAAIARRFIEQNPNDPLTDRVRKFTAPAAAGNAGQ